MCCHLHTQMLLLPVVVLLWSSPGIHFSFTLLLLCSDSTKYSGASGTSENHHNNMALENHRHINLCSKNIKINKKKAKGTNVQSNHPECRVDVERAASIFLRDFKNVRDISKGWLSVVALIKSACSHSALVSWHIDQTMQHRGSLILGLGAEMFSHLTPWAAQTQCLGLLEFSPHMCTHPGPCGSHWKSEECHPPQSICWQKKKTKKRRCSIDWQDWKVKWLSSWD